MVFACPRPTALPSISTPSCPVNFDQIVRIFLQQKQASPTDLSDPADMFTASTWTTLFAATNATKAVKTPLFGGFTLPQSEGQFENSDNSAIFGIGSYIGENPVTVTAQFKSLQASVAEQIRQQTQFSLPEAVPGLTAFFVTRNGQILCDAGGAGIRIYNLRVSSVGSAGYNAKNLHNLSFQLPEGWDKEILLLSPPDDATFKPLEV